MRDWSDTTQPVLRKPVRRSRGCSRGRSRYLHFRSVRYHALSAVVGFGWPALTEWAVMRARVGRCGRHSWDVAPRGAPVFGGYICLDRALSSMGKIRRRHRVQAHRASWRRTDVVFARHPHNTTRGQGHKALSVDAAMAQALASEFDEKADALWAGWAASHPPPPTPGPPRSFAISTTVSTASRRSIARRCAGAYCRQRRNARKPSAGCSMIASISEKEEHPRVDHRPIPQIWPQV